MTRPLTAARRPELSGAGSWHSSGNSPWNGGFATPSCDEGPDRTEEPSVNYLVDLVSAEERVGRMRHCCFCRRRFDSFAGFHAVVSLCSEGCVDRIEERQAEPPFIGRLVAGLSGAAIFGAVLVIAHIIRG